VPPRKTPSQSATPVEELWNLSALTAGWLRALGIRTRGDLERRDLIEVWLALRLEHPQVTRLMYYALWGAVNDLHWKFVPKDAKRLFDEAVERRRAADGTPAQGRSVSAGRHRRSDLTARRRRSRPR
jgi:DNA transformation protein